MPVSNVNVPTRKFTTKKKYIPKIPVFKWIKLLYYERLTPSGRTLFWLALISFALGMTTTLIKVYMVFSFIGIFFLVSFILSWVFLPKINVKRVLPDKTTCGQTLFSEIKIENPGKRKYYDIVFCDRNLPSEIISIGCDGYYLKSLSSKELTSTKTGFKFTRRGEYNIEGMSAETIFPFGIWSFGKKLTPPHKFIVYPRFNRLEKLDIPVGKRYQPGGIALTSSLGESTEFIGNREFREGDNPKNIHFRSWAKVMKPVVKEFHEEYFCRIALLLDTYIEPKLLKKEITQFEGAISMAASVSDYLSRQEYIIDIFAAGPNIYYMQAGRSLAYLDNILDLLACIQPCNTCPFEILEPVLMENLAGITTVIAVFLNFDEKRRDFLQKIKDCGTAVKLIIIRDGNTTIPTEQYTEDFGNINILSSKEELKGVTSL